eukprot:gb/GECG01008638.1/.p1 GENE.gb/GECG01008638.1/~~gb/GECG01008638.1/.p1  ORF type:complete len:413 (+),score=83.49 gb/GECG01008638.1/:1-1239(+)
MSGADNVMSAMMAQRTPPPAAMGASGGEVFEAGSSSDDDTTHSNAPPVRRHPPKEEKEEADQEAELDTAPVDTARAYRTFMEHQYRQSFVHTYKSSRRPIEETPFDRLQRLQREIEEVSDDMQSLKGTQHGVHRAEISRYKTPEGQHGKSLWEDVDEQIEALRKKLESNNTALDEMHGFEEDSKTLTERLKGLRDETSASAADKTQTQQQTVAENTGAAALVETKFLDTLRGLSRRIDQVESVTGTHPPTFSNTNNVDQPTDTLADQVKKLEEQIALLDPSKMKQCADKARELSSDLQEIRKSMAAHSSQSHVDRIQRICERIEKWDAVVESLPSIADRLSTLHVLHTEAALFSQRLHTLEQTRSTVEERLQEDAELLKTIKQQLSENMSTILTQVESIDKRIEGLESPQES